MSSHTIIIFFVALIVGATSDLPTVPDEIPDTSLQRDVVSPPATASPKEALPGETEVVPQKNDDPDPYIQIQQEDPAVKNLRAFLRINTAQPAPEQGYEKAIEWLRKQAEEIGLEFNILGMGDTGSPHCFALWMTWKGSDPLQKSILLNSHMDVVSADSDKWKHPPFEAYKDEFGNIYARGAVDMKSATIAELEAIRKLKRSGFQPIRTIHLMIMPDEERSSSRGVEPFLKTEQFKNLNVGVDIDEGFPVDSDDIIHVEYGQKSAWMFNITAYGDSAHASTMPRYTAGQRLQVVIDKLNEFRASEYRKLETMSLEDITSLNLVQIGGGFSNNVIPHTLWATYDMRIRFRPGWNFSDVDNMIKNVTTQAQLGNGTNNVTVEYITQSFHTGLTTVNDSSVWWKELQKSCRDMNATCEPHIFTAGTDGRFLRNIGIPVYGFNPFPNTKYIAHENNEVINEANFLRGVERYAILIKNFANVPGETKQVTFQNVPALNTSLTHTSISSTSASPILISYCLPIVFSYLCAYFISQ